MQRIDLWIVSLSLAALLAAGCAPSGPQKLEYAKGKGVTTPDGLHRVGGWQPFRSTFVRPGADLQAYNKVLVKEVTVSYKTPPRRGHRMANDMHPNYALPDSAIASLKKYFHEIFTEDLGKSQNFTVVEKPGPDVLLIEAHIVNLQFTVPPERDLSPDETVYTTSSGQMTLILDARDSVSGESLVRVGQARAIQMADSGWYGSNPVSNSSAVRDTLRSWAQMLRSELDRFHQLPMLPPLPAETPPE